MNYKIGCVWNIKEHLLQDGMAARQQTRVLPLNIVSLSIFSNSLQNLDNQHVLDKAHRHLLSLVTDARSNKLNGRDARSDDQV